LFVWEYGADERFRKREVRFFLFFFFFFLFLLSLQAMETAKSGLVLFHEAIERCGSWRLKESFVRFERAAAKGHEESIWIGSVVKDVDMNKNALIEAFAKTEEPLGWYIAGELSDDGRERFDFFKKSAEGGFSWGQVAYGWRFRDGFEFVEQDKKAHVEWLEKAANQNNPEAMYWLGDWFRKKRGNDKKKAVSYFRAGAELGWKSSMRSLAYLLRNGEECARDLRQAAIWGAKGDSYVFWDQLGDARRALESETTKDLDCDFDQLCYLLGWGLYWYTYDVDNFNFKQHKVFGERCLDYCCSCVKLQQESIFLFLLCWNRTTGGVKDVGVIIGKMVWEGREENLVKVFEEPRRRSARLKRILKSEKIKKKE
jgi:hypothetical protein